MTNPRPRNGALRPAWWLIGAGVLAAVSTAGPLGQAAGSAHAPAAAARVTVTLSPLPGTPDASPQTQISVLGAPAGDVGHISVVGSRSGRHAGKLVAYASAPGASFVLRRAFRAGKRVRVHVTGSSAAPGLRAATHFVIARHTVTRAKRPPPLPPPAHVRRPTRLSFVSRPDLHPPRLRVTKIRHTAPGDLFFGPIVSAATHHESNHGPMITDPHGHLVWFSRIRGPDAVVNFRAQSLLGKPVLTWWQGVIDSAGFGHGEDIILNDAYQRVRVIHSANGYRPDLHEFVLSPGGRAWTTAVSTVKLHSFSVLDSIVQEIDVRTGLVMWEWHSFGHLRLRESYQKRGKGQTWDAFHLNSIQDVGGKVLLSARNTWAVYLVSIHSGRIVWRLGGKHSSFRLGRGVRFAWQHDARLRSGGRVSLFDDEAAPPVHRRSRGLIIRIRHRRATLARQFLHPSPLLAGSQGNLQPLPNGDSLVGWGQEPYVSEYSRSGRLVFDAHFPRPVHSYRAFRLAWAGRPARPPDVAVRSRHRGGLSVYASWNGDSAVSAWQVLGGASPSTLAPVGGARRTGFETTIPVASRPAYLVVRALDGAGHVLRASRVVKG